jgi:DNA-binding PadR family transcriptional regulator
VSVGHSLLALLSKGSRHGLQLREEFDARTGEVWRSAHDHRYRS